MDTPSSKPIKKPITTPSGTSEHDKESLQADVIAPLWKRFMAMLYDSFLVVAISMAYGATVTAVSAFQSSNMTKDYSPTVSGLGFQLGWVLTLFIFYYYFWRKAGQTVGMKAWRLKIVSNNNERLSLTQCLTRFFGGFISFVLLGAGFWWALIDNKKATAHDKMSNSRIVVTPKAAKSKGKPIIPDANKRR